MAIDWTPELEEAFFEGILAGKSIASIATETGISPASFYRHRLENEKFETNIARAQEVSQEREVDELIALADQADEENSNAIKLRVWTRMWVAGKRKPKKYGDKQQLELSGSLELAQRLEAAKKRVEGQLEEPEDRIPSPSHSKHQTYRVGIQNYCADCKLYF